MTETRLRAEDVKWIVNDLSELGVMIGSQSFFLYKGESLVYGDALHDDTKSPMQYRAVGKREFGEVCKPLGEEASPGDDFGWTILPPAPMTETQTAPMVQEIAKAFYASDAGKEALQLQWGKQTPEGGWLASPQRSVLERHCKWDGPIVPVTVHEDADGELAIVPALAPAPATFADETLFAAINVTSLDPHHVYELRAHADKLRWQMTHDERPVPPHGWTCFYCAQTFPTWASASAHFGDDPRAGRPECLANIVDEALRAEDKIGDGPLRNAARDAVLKVLRNHGYDIPGIADLCAGAALRAFFAALATAPAVPDGRAEEVERLRAELKRASAAFDAHDELLHQCLDERDQLRAENKEMRAAFDAQYNAGLRAIRMWQDANPGQKNVWPDTAKLLVWLLEECDRLKLSGAEQTALMSNEKIEKLWSMLAEVESETPPLDTEREGYGCSVYMTWDSIDRLRAALSERRT